MASAGNAALVAALSSLSLGPSRGSRGGGVRCFCFRRPLPLRRSVKRATTTFSVISPHRRCPPSSTASQVKARKREPIFPLDEEEEEPPFDPIPRPEGYVPPPSIDEVEESEFEVGVAYEKMYGPAYSGETFLGGDIHVMDAKAKKDEGMFGSSEVKRERPKDGMEERVVQVRRVTKVVKGGKQLGFRAVVVVGDKAGTVGVGIGQAREVTDAVEKATINARRELVTIPVTKYSTFPHRSEGKYGAAKVMLRPASPGSGVIAGGAVRAVLEMAGIQNGLGKQLGSENALNNARATLVAVRKMWQFREVAEVRGIPMEELWK